MKKVIKTLGTAILSGTLLLTSACTAGFDMNPASEGTNRNTAQTEAPLQPANQGNGSEITRERAVELALAKAEVTKDVINDLEVELDDNVYEVDFDAYGVEYDIDVRKSNGDIVKFELDRADDKNDSADAITRDQAVEIALAKVQITRDQVTDLEVERDDRVWEVDFDALGKEYDIDVRINGGDIVKLEIDVDDDYNENASRPAQTQPASTAITHERALEIALNRAGLTRDAIHDLDIELDDGEYEIDFDANGSEYDIDVRATDGAITKYEVDNDDDANSTATGHISRDQALEIALNRAGLTRADITDLDIEWDDDNEYEIEFDAKGFDYDIDVRATDGAILSYEVDVDDDDDDDDRDDDRDDDDDDRPQTTVAPAPTTVATTQAPTQATTRANRDDDDDDDDDDRPRQTNPTTAAPAPTTKATTAATAAPTQPTSSRISRDRALAIALNRAGVSQSSIRDLDIELDDGKYEIDFEAGRYEYEFDIRARDGAILEYERNDNDDYYDDDDWDDDDDDDYDDDDDDDDDWDD